MTLAEQLDTFLKTRYSGIFSSPRTPGVCHIALQFGTCRSFEKVAWDQAHHPAEFLRTAIRAALHDMRDKIANDLLELEAME